MSAAASIRSLYIHIPFCERKCEYCDFTSVAGVRGEAEYVVALIEELCILAERLPGVVLDTVFVGGGTPSLIDPQSLARVLDTVQHHFTVRSEAEITLEANPSSTDAARASVWHDAGFNRVSLGVQSLEPDILSFLGRVHDATGAVQAIDDVRTAGFRNVNCDLIYAVPGLDDVRWDRTLQRVVARAPDHISCYELTVEPGTALHTSVLRGRVTPVDGERALAQHCIARDALAAAGYEQYEVSNFSHDGQRCLHNLAYWRNRHYLAAGVGAHGHVTAEAARALGLPVQDDAVAARYWHGRGIGAYVETMRRRRLPIRDVESVDAVTHEEERLMLGLRLRDGVRLRDSAVMDQARLLQDRGLLALDGDVARVTDSGENVLNAVVERLCDALHTPAAALTL
ncbi:MAG: radical SAM family heme chaperone HemW [Candidatus Dormibacteria bacterium]